MPWKEASLAKFLKGATALANEISSYLNKKIAAIMILKSIIQAFLSGIIDQINYIQSLIAAFEAQGFYVILLSPSKGNWSSRLRLAPGAPPEGTDKFCTCGVCVIATAPSFDASIQAFMSALGALRDGIKLPDPSKAVVKQKSMHAKPKTPAPLIQTDVWKSLTIADLLPGVGAMASDLADGMIGFIADLQHTVAQIAAFATNALELAKSATGFINELNNAGAYAISLKPKNSTIVQRLVSEDNAPPQDVTLYSVGFCVCFYAMNFGQCEEKYNQLCQIFDPNIANYQDLTPPPTQIYYGGPESYLPSTVIATVTDPSTGAVISTDSTIPQKIKSWTVPKAGFYHREVYVTLSCNVEGATIYYTVNGGDPKIDPQRKKYDGTAIHVLTNNTVIKHFAQFGILIEKQTRSSVYKIVSVIDPVIPISPTYGIVPGVGVDPTTGAGDLTIPPNPNWGTQEGYPPSDPLTSGITYFDNGVPTYDLDSGGNIPTLGDAGNLVKDVTGTVVGVAPEYAPPAINNTLIPPDDPDPIDAVTAIVDVRYAAVALVEKNIGVYGGGLYSGNELDSGIVANLITPIVVGIYGEQPWGRTSLFPDDSAKWVWNCEKPADGIMPKNSPALFTVVYKNETGADINAALHYMADNTAVCYINNVLVDTDSGWYPVGNGNVNLASWQIASGYRTVYVTLVAGQTYTFSWVATNWGGSAGLIYSLKDTVTGFTIINSGDSTPAFVTQADWYLTNMIVRSDYTVSQASVVLSLSIDVYYGKDISINISELVGSTISAFESDSKGLSISDDKKSVVGTVDFPGALTLSIRLDTGALANLLLVAKTVPDTATTTEYSPIAHDLHYRVASGNSVIIKLSARNTELELADPTVKFTIISYPQHGSLVGSGDTYTYTPEIGTGGLVDSFEYLAYNMAATSSSAVVEIDIV